MLLCHFVKGRLYDRDLKNDEVFETIGGRPIRISRQLPGNSQKEMDFGDMQSVINKQYVNYLGNVTVNRASIIESEIFVYNLGTMFYIDQILYADILADAIKPMTSDTYMRGKSNNKVSTSSDSEVVIPASDLPGDPIEKRNYNRGGTNHHHDDDDDADDSHFQDDEIITPRALPVRFANLPKK